jgi:FkbM family methyltransferase
MGKVMDFVVGSTTVSLLENGDRICGHIQSGNTFEPQSLAAWAEMCEKGGTVIDVGGYSGLFAIAAAKMGCHVICFEPMPLNASRILENCHLNGVNVELHNAVASDEPGIVDLTYNPKVEGMTSGASLVRKKGFKLPVRAMTIDSLNVNPVAIKIDVERGEPLVLAGARETLARARPQLLVEVLDEEREELVRKSVDGYRVAAVVDVRNWLMIPC